MSRNLDLKESNFEFVGIWINKLNGTLASGEVPFSTSSLISCIVVLRRVWPCIAV